MALLGVAKGRCPATYCVTLVGCLAAGWQPAAATVVTVKSGMHFEGRVDKIGSLNENPLSPSRTGGEAGVKPIIIIDDDLRFTFFAESQVAAFGESPPGAQERIKIDQKVATSGRRIAAVGPILHITPFDEWGRRTFSMRGPRGRLDVIQGITEITPRFTKVEGLLVSSSFVWDMRVNTNSIPRETLSSVLLRQIDARDADARLRIVRLYIQAERYRDALVELERVVRDFPDLADLKGQADGLRQLLAQQVLKEIELRQRAGQHQRANALLSEFPQEGIAGETLVKVRDMLADYAKQKEMYERALKLLESHIGELKEGAHREALAAIHEEIRRSLNIHTLSRMADYLRLADDASLTAERKVSLAVSGWLLGSGAAIDNLAISLSLIDVRNAVVEFLRATRPHERDAQLEKIKGYEGASPDYVAKILENIRPPWDMPNSEQKVPGLLEITVPGTEEQSEFRYYIQLPPEYDPWHKYPCVVTLNGAGSSELQQIDWWAGEYREKSQMRLGQAARRGFVVMAPKWQKPYQTQYDYSAREHSAVLFCLRDAYRRFSLDTNRVFLSGHSIGGEAAWDIGASHPDLWAGVIPIVAYAAKYVNYYAKNVRGLPLYFVGGQLDCNWQQEKVQGNWLQDNGSEFDRYLSRAKYDCTVVEYRGRGHEPFEDEIQRILDWMELTSHTRNFFPKEFTVASMRPWDSFFWWLELGDIPRRCIVYPAEWPPERGTRAIETTATVRDNNRISVDANCGRVTVWLSPKMLSFDRPMGVSVDGRDVREDIKPSVEVLLEDVRTRGDRQNPFWAKVEWSKRRS